MSLQLIFYQNMEQNQILRCDLIRRCRETFQSYSMSERTVEIYIRYVRALVIFMESRKINAYTHEIGEEYARLKKDNPELSGSYKMACLRTVRVVNQVLDGKPYINKEGWKPEYKLEGELGQLAEEYICMLKEARRNVSTIEDYRRVLSRFCTEMKLKERTSQNLTRADVVHFVDGVQGNRTSSIGNLKRFLAYLFENGKLSSNLGSVIANVKIVRDSKLISYYSPEEVMKIEASVDRTGVVGKRNYAIILLASRLGLRSSDIRMLEFANIDWDKSQIRLLQYKTKQWLTLPLLSDVGEALIDYIQNGHPKCDIKKVFTTVVHPYRSLGKGSMTKIVKDCIEKAGIYAGNRHTGLHCLRHSLATTMLGNGTDMPVISEALGHSSTQSTMCYLGVDIKGLLECSLPVPPVDDEYYTQKGGVFYD